MGGDVMMSDETEEAYRAVAHALGVCFEAEGHSCEPGDLSDVLQRAAELADLEREHIEEALPQRLDAWHEEDGPVLWWRFPVKEPPYVGSPLDDDFPSYVTHWTRIRVSIDPNGEP